MVARKGADPGDSDRGSRTDDRRTRPDAVLRYFSRRYPVRESWFSGRVFRRGEEPSREQLRCWLPSGDGLEILDAGCGDGGLLASVLHGTPARLRLEDLVPDNVRIAGERLAGRAERIETHAGDLRACDDPTRYDVVLAVGVFDYHEDWPALLGTLLERSRGVLIFDLPRAGVLHHRVRRPWLALHGLSLQTVGRERLQREVARLGIDIEIVGTRFSWMARARRR